MTREVPKLPSCRYADDGLIHCRTLKQSQFVQARLAQRLRECGLEIHPEKTKIVYCKDVHRQQEHEHIQFDFLGYTFRPRRSFDRYGRLFVNFSPAIARKAATALRQEVRSWRLQLKSDHSLEELARMFNAVISGWFNYYGRFYPSAFEAVGNHINRAIVRWAMRNSRAYGVTKAKRCSTLTGMLALRRWLGDGSRMSREVHVRFCESPRVRFPRATYPYIPMRRGFIYLFAILDWDAQGPRVVSFN